jgi:hypothetical protein
LIVAIIKQVPDNSPGAISGATKDLTLPAFSFASNRGLAEMIIEAWKHKDFRDQLLKRDAGGKVTDDAAQLATSSVNARGFNLTRAVVISEKEHDGDYKMQTDDEVVFVLPNNTRIGTPFTSSDSLLETARLLMACTPNGI